MTYLASNLTTDSKQKSWKVNGGEGRIRVLVRDNPPQPFVSRAYVTIETRRT